MPGLDRRRAWRLFAFAAALGLVAYADVALAAQTASPAPAGGVSDQLFDSQKAAFDALSEPDRRAIQDALVWTGDYNGTVDGAFGKRTRDSILAYQASIKAPASGIVDTAEFAALVATAEKAKNAVKFQIAADDKTGIKIGAPLKLLDKRAANGAGSRLMNSDGSVTLDLSSLNGAEANLPTLYARLSAEAPGRKITLKLSRPDFFVVSGEEGGRKFYARFAKAPANWPDASVVRSFTLSYPTALVSFDRIGVAVANSFEPFPTNTPAAVIASKPAANAPAKPPLAASGLLVASGEALTAIRSGECPRPSIGGKPAKYLREDKESGLSLIDMGGAPGASVSAPVLAPLDDDLVALTYATDVNGLRPALDVAAVSPLHETMSDARPLLVASLPPSATGGPVFNRKGDLVAIVAGQAAAAKTVAGVTPIAPHPVVAASDIERFLDAADVAHVKPSNEALAGAGRIAADKRALVVSIVCN